MKKFLAFLLVLAIAGGGYYFYTNQGGENDEPLVNPNGEVLVEAEENTLVGTLPFVWGNGVDFGYTVESLKELMLNTDAKYLWFEKAVNDTLDVYSVPEVTFWENVISANEASGFKLQSSTPIFNESDTIRRLAELHITKLTSDGRNTGDGMFTSYYLSHYIGKKWECLNGAPVDTDESYQFFEKHNLKLGVSNATASTVLCGAEQMCNFPTYGIVVTAEVGKISNGGQFKNLEWIPSSGKNLITFFVIMDYNNEENVGKRSNIVDIIVLDYQPINN